MNVDFATSRDVNYSLMICFHFLPFYIIPPKNATTFGKKPDQFSSLCKGCNFLPLIV